MARYTAVLDSCALVPIALADTLLRVAERGLYRPLWPEAIVGETVDAIVESPEREVLAALLDPQFSKSRYNRTYGRGPIT
jgi:hypothetical protein